MAQQTIVQAGAFTEETKDKINENFAELYGDVDGSVAAAVAIIAAIPTVDPEDSETIWNDGGVLKVASAGG